jgi:hypothetical protein
MPDRISCSISRWKAFDLYNKITAEKTQTFQFFKPESKWKSIFGIPHFCA